MPPWEQYQSKKTADQGGGSETSGAPWLSYSPSQENQSIDLLDVPGQALQNLGTSAKGAAEGIVQPIRHPIETAKGLGHLAGGVASKMGVPGMKEYEPTADAVGKMFVDRYGGWENIKRTMATDPVGFVLDLSTVATGGETALARLPGAIGKVGEIAGTVSRVTDPINVAAKALPVAGKAATKALGGYTGMGEAGLEEARRTGKAGGVEQQTHLANLRDPQGTMGDIVPKARAALEQLYQEKSANYLRNKAQFDARSIRPLDFTDIDAAIARNEDVGKFLGFDVSKLAGEKELTDAQKMLEDIEKNVEYWRKLPNAFHTGPGLDALKRHIGAKADWRTRSDAANKIAKDVYHAVRDTIAKQDPKYAADMAQFSQAHEMIREVEKTLSLGKKASEDTALRKLLSTTRSGVNTNFGRRMDLAKELNRKDPTIIPALAGQAGSPWVPQGLAKLIPAGVGAGEAAAHGVLATLKNPSVLAAIAGSSPRLWSEIYSKIGSAQRKAGEITPQAIINAAKKAGQYEGLIRSLGKVSRAAGVPGRLRVNVGTGEVTNAPQ